MMTAEPAGRRVRGVVLDLDGTVYDEHGLVPHADTAIAFLRRAGLGLCFATNTTRRSRQALVDRLGTFGIRVAPAEVMTAPLAAVGFLQSRSIEAIGLHVAAATEGDFDSFVRDEEAPEAVVVGDLGDGWTFGRLNQAFRQVMAGAELVALQKNRYWRTTSGLTLDAGPFVAALEYATGKHATLVGKPSDAFFSGACERLGLPRERVVMVGDDVESDVRGAMQAGLGGVLVKTGKFRPEDLLRIGPDQVIDSLADLPRWVERWT